VDWYVTYEYATKFAADHGITLSDLPIAGTQAWCGMPDDDARKLLSLILGGVRDALTNDQHQEAMTDAGREIAGAENWSALAQRVRYRASDHYIPRRKSA
jgi:hypothetical protein